MAYFEWAEDMAIDHGPIDTDHQHLVRLVNDLHTATTEGRGHDVVGPILDELIRYTTEHLTREERQMAALGFPQLAGHQKGHAQFVADLQRLQQRYRDGHITVAAQLSTVLRDWLSLHIRRSDKALYFFMKQQARETGQK